MTNGPGELTATVASPYAWPGSADGCKFTLFHVLDRTVTRIFHQKCTRICSFKTEKNFPKKGPRPLSNSIQ